MATSYLERELKFDVPDGFQLPGFAGAGRVVTEAQVQTHQLDSHYFDTTDHALLEASMTLRRRTGSTDAGWQLKVPHQPAREEIRVGLHHGEPDSVPDELATLLLGVRRGQPLVPVALLHTERALTKLCAADGTVLAEVADDTVQASVPGDGSVTAAGWREVEIELAAGDEALLAELADRLIGAGARPSASASKLSRALAVSSQPVRAARRPLLAYLREQQQVMLAGDIALRRNDRSVIHKTRVATRRFRSTLRTFAAVLGTDAVGALDAELRWYAALLGDIRDRQVLEQRLLDLVSGLDDRWVLGPVRARIQQELDREQAEHWNVLLEAMSGERYLALLDAVHDFLRQPGWYDGLQVKASTLLTLARKSDRKAARRLIAAAEADSPELLHRARKAAKRARYAGEATEPLARKKSHRQATRNERIQELLGEHQDSIVSAEVLLRFGTIAGTTGGENGFTFGLLYEIERQRARETRKRARKVARASS